VTTQVWELVVVDNGPDASTAAVIDLHRAAFDRLTVIIEPRRGLGSAQRAGVRQSLGRIVAFTDDDCYVAPDFVDALVAAFGEDPSVGFVGGRILLHDLSDAAVTVESSEIRRYQPARELIRAGQFQGANLAFLRCVLDQIDRPDPRLGPGTPYNCVDIDMVAEASWSGFAGAYDPRPTVYHHHGRKLADLPALRIDYARGRGAHFANRILDPRSRRTYAKAWAGDFWRCIRTGHERRTMLWELRSGLHYVWHAHRGTAPRGLGEAQKSTLAALGVHPVGRRACRNLPAE
jgi:GT2 family glycosyltransferase